MPDPARLTTLEMQRYAVLSRPELEARLAAAENVVKAAAKHNDECVYGSLALADALAAYDMHKEDTP